MLSPVPRSGYPQNPEPFVVSQLHQKRNRRRSETGCERAGNDRLYPEVYHFFAPFRRHRAESADHDAEAAEIREAAQRVREQQTAARRDVDHFRQVEVGDELVDDGLGAEERPGGARLVPRNAAEPRKRRESPAERALERIGRDDQIDERAGFPPTNRNSTRSSKK